MYTSVKLKTKNIHGLSVRTTVYHNDENNLITIQVVMIVPNKAPNHHFKVIRKLKNHKVIINYLIFKLPTAINITDGLSSIFTSIMQRNNLTNIEFSKFAKNINYETQSNT